MTPPVTNVVAANGATSTIAVPAVVVNAGNTGAFGILAKDFSFLQGYGSNPTTIRGVTPPASWTYLASQGVRRVRMFLYAPITLDANESARLLTEISNAYSAGVRVIVADVTNNYNTAQFVSFWTQMSTLLKGNPGVLAYDLMNEPNNVTSSSSSNTVAGNQADAAVWKALSQAAVTAIRNNGDTTRIHVEGVDYSNPENWALYQGSTPWITDPANNIVYSAHLYPDYNGLFNLSTGGGASDYRFSTTKAYFEAHYTGGTNFVTWNLNRLAAFASWCSSHGVKGDIGETAWPSAYAMTSIQGLSASVANTEAALWNTNFGVPFLQALKAAGMSMTFEQGTGFANSAWGASAGTTIFNNSTGGGQTVIAGKYTPLAINQSQSPYAAFQAAGIWP